MGHVALAITWGGGEELLLVHAGLSEEKYALADLAVLQTATEAWFYPEAPAGEDAKPPARAFHCGAVLGRKAYVFGGHVWVKEKRGLHKFNDLWALDTDVWAWSKVEALGPQPAPRDFAGLVDLPDGRLLLFGGLDASERRLDDTWIFDPSQSAWTELKVERHPRARYAHSLARMANRLFLFGGEANAGLCGDLWTLRGLGADDEAASWIPLELPGSPPSARKGAAMAAVGLWLVVMGGRTADLGWFRTRTDTFHNDLVAMDRDGGDGAVRWTAPSVTGDAPAPREFHSLTSLSGGRLFLIGGGNGKQIFGDAWWLETDAVPYPGSAADTSFAQLSDALFPPAALAKVGRARGSTGSSNAPLSCVSVDAPGELRPRGDRDAASLAGSEAVSAGVQVGARHTPSGAEGPSASDRPFVARASWWAGTSASPGFESLRSRVGLPAQALDPGDEAGHGAERASMLLHGLGVQKRGQSGIAPAEAARSFLATAQPQELRMRDVECMLLDYQARGVRAAGDVRLSDVHSLQLGYQEALKL
ncbi:hypothetical protein WJX81_006132 [Elliptochloris bilobata]|uniref:Uncharacterized protein n=1 Tax=Elliptochloris bilobata TaxID=381761 RepID=A0AAW1SJS0_9CHLO